MIRAGKLDRTLTVQRLTETIAPSGAVSKQWGTIATVRAEKVQASAKEYLTGFGEAERGAAVFRLWYLDGITTADRVLCDGVTYELNEIAEIGRRHGLELHCSEVAQ